MHGGQLIHRRELGQLERIILVGLAFDLGPPPCLGGGIGDSNLKSHRADQIVHPPADLAGLEHHQCGGSILAGNLVQLSSDCLPIGGQGDKRMNRGGRVKDTQNRVEFAQVNGDNTRASRQRLRRLW